MKDIELSSGGRAGCRDTESHVKQGSPAEEFGQMHAQELSVP